MAKRRKSRGKSRGKSPVKSYLKSRGKGKTRIRQPKLYRNHMMSQRQPGKSDLQISNQIRRQRKQAGFKESKKQQIYRAISDFSPGEVRAAQMRAGIKGAYSKKEGKKVLQQLLEPQMTVRRESRRRGRGGRGGGQQSAKPSTQPTNQYQPEIADILGGEPDQQVFGQPVADPYADALAALQQTIAGLQFEMPDYGAQFEEMMAMQANQIAEMEARQAEEERQRELAFRTSQENMARGGMQADFRIGARSPRDLMGTGGFKRRPRRRPAVVAQGITPVQQTINGMVPNTLQNRGINT